MTSDPEPNVTVDDFWSARVNLDYRALEIEAHDLLEVKRGMAWILPQQRVRSIRAPSDIGRKFVVASPEIGVRKVAQIGVVRPAA